MIKLLDLTNVRHQRIVAEEISKFKKNNATRIFENNIRNKQFSRKKVLNWFEENADLVKDFKLGVQDYNTIINFLSKGNPSQYYLKTLIDVADKLKGVAIDDSDFYEDDDNDTSTPMDNIVNTNINPRSIFPGMPLD